MILTALTLFALSPHIYFGHTLVLSLGIKPWDQVFGAIQANGRAFWLVGYTLVLASIAKITRDLPRVGLRVVLIAAISLQLIDTAPLRAAARDYFAGRSQQPAAIDTLPGAHWLTIVPVCGHPGRAAEVAGELRLGAVRAGMWLRDMRVSRLPHWFNCESALTDGVEMPLLPREMRVFLEPPATTLFRQAALGPDISCRSVAQMIVCARDLALHIGAAVAPGTPLPELVLPASDVTGGALKKLCSYGWHEDDLGLFWSEGPRASLLFHVLPTQPAGALLLHLQIDGVARSPGAGPTDHCASWCRSVSRHRFAGHADDDGRSSSTQFIDFRRYRSRGLRHRSPCRAPGARPYGPSRTRWRAFVRCRCTVGGGTFRPNAAIIRRLAGPRAAAGNVRRDRELRVAACVLPCAQRRADSVPSEDSTR